jgi:hypothetical protein
MGDRPLGLQKIKGRCEHAGILNQILEAGGEGLLLNLAVQGPPPTLFADVVNSMNEKLALRHRRNSVPRHGRSRRRPGPR